MAHVTITLTLTRAKDIDASFADLLCWTRGYEAATPDAIDRHPIGIEGVRLMREALQKAMRNTDEGTDND